MSEWKQVRLGDVVEIIMGQSPSGENSNSNAIGIPLLNGPTEFGSHHPKAVQWTTDSRKNCNAKDLLFCVRGSTTGRMNWADLTYSIGRGLAAIRHKKGYDYKYFVKGLIDHKLPEILVAATGSTFPNVGKEMLNNLNVVIPSLETQKKIAAVLSALDEKIELNNKINKDLEDMAQAIFKSWFVDFEPFGGVMPDGWMVKNLSEIANIDSGYSYKGAELQPSSTAMATIKNFERLGGFKLTGFKEIIPSNKIKNSHYVNKFDILVAHTDLTQNADIIGNAEILLSLDQYDKIIASMDLVKVTAKENYNNFFIATMLKSKNFKDHALSYVNGTTVLHLSKKALHEYSIFLPNDISIIDKTSQSFKWIYTQISSNLEESSILSQFRDTLLPRLMSGEIDVEKVEV